MKLSLINDTKDSTDDLSLVPPAWLSLVDVIFVLILIPILDKRIYPWLDRKGWSLSVFTRISIGKFSDHVIVSFFFFFSLFHFVFEASVIKWCLLDIIALYLHYRSSPVKMFLSSRQAGYSNWQQRPKLQGPPHLDAILFVPGITVTADHPFGSLSHAMTTQCSRRSYRINRVELRFT